MLLVFLQALGLYLGILVLTLVVITILMIRSERQHAKETVGRLDKFVSEREPTEPRVKNSPYSENHFST